MHKTILALAVTLSFTASAADDQQYDQWFGGFIEYYDTDKNYPDNVNPYDNGDGLGIEYGMRINPRWAARFEWSSLDMDYQNSNNDVSGDRYGVDALYFMDSANTYLFAGIKKMDIAERYSPVNLGIGRHWHLNDSWKLVTEFAAYHAFNEDITDFGFKLGLAYKFGQTSGSAYQPVNTAPETASTTSSAVAPEAAATPPKDSDGDGVNDEQDRCANTPAEDKVDAQGCSIFTEEQVEASMAILFANNSYEVQNPDSQQLSEFAEFLRRFPNTDAEIEGHTSLVGDKAYNQKLSEQRANAVRDVLIQRYGIDADRLSTIGYGETRPLIDANTAEASRKNRRIHTRVTAMKKVKVTR
ncbi:OmpA family protein [Lacimicrobium alkaliphilum]|uniref:Outer membrane porin F n=1 Tax=Lacimicrobium alkaliphilum TaxID=1526571 RepID=A0ABQ1RNE3_9ALTE|nr:OmpA family protein [Lacimicrobium alkaliphilum]GGD72870.1 outer membrane porin F [Lacimicrobium alkaliphilum]